VWIWQEPGGERLLVAVNYSAGESQCYVSLPIEDIGAATWHLDDLLGEACYIRDGRELQSRGLYLDMAPWQYHAFEVRRE
jgi:hypothetical protein